jgi:4-amino-4-deoxy-L-arabinose transferase-like glycosyltransferase
MERFTRSTIYVLLLCVLIRLGVMVLAAPWTPATVERLVGDSDPRGYHTLGVNLAMGKGYFRYGESKSSDNKAEHKILSRDYAGEPEVLWPPGYPAFLALNYKIFGVQLTSVILLQILLATVGCFFLISAVRLLYGERAGIWAGLLYSVDPVSVYLSNVVWSEALFIPMMAVVVYCFARVLSAETMTARFQWIILLGVALGACTWVRVSTFPLLAGLIPLLCFLWWRRGGHIWRAAPPVLALSVSFFVTILPWYIRNYNLFGVWAFSTSGSYNLLAGLGYLEGKETLFRRAYQEALRDGKQPHQLGPFERAQYWRKVALQEWQSEFPKHFLGYLKRLVVVMTTPSTSGWGELLGIALPQTSAASASWGETVREFLKKVTSPLGIVAVYSVIYVGIVYLAVVFRVLSAFRTDKYLLYWLALALISILTLVVVSAARGRVQASLFLIPPAAAYLASKFHIVKDASAPQGE